MNTFSRALDQGKAAIITFDILRICPVQNKDGLRQADPAAKRATSLAPIMVEVGIAGQRDKDQLCLFRAGREDFVDVDHAVALGRLNSAWHLRPSVEIR